MRNQLVAKVLLLCLFAGMPAMLLLGPAQPPEAISSSDLPDPAKNLSWRFERDDAGRVTKIIDPAGRATDIVHEFDTVKRQRRLVRKAPDGSQVAFTFDARGRRIGRQDHTGAVSYQYDERNLLTNIGHDGTPEISYAYDAKKRLKSVTLGGQKIAYSYDFLGRMTAIDTPAGKISYQHQTAQGASCGGCPTASRPSGNSIRAAGCRR